MDPSKCIILVTGGAGAGLCPNPDHYTTITGLSVWYLLLNSIPMSSCGCSPLWGRSYIWALTVLAGALFGIFWPPCNVNLFLSTKTFQYNICQQLPTFGDKLHRGQAGQHFFHIASVFRRKQSTKGQMNNISLSAMTKFYVTCGHRLALHLQISKCAIIRFFFSASSKPYV